MKITFDMCWCQTLANRESTIWNRCRHRWRINGHIHFCCKAELSLAAANDNCVVAKWGFTKCVSWVSRHSVHLSSCGKWEITPRPFDRVHLTRYTAEMMFAFSFVVAAPWAFADETTNGDAVSSKTVGCCSVERRRHYLFSCTNECLCDYFEIRSLLLKTTSLCWNDQLIHSI